MLTPINRAIQALYIEFELLLESYEELTDTDVRESIHMTLNYYFVLGKSSNRLPISFGMFSCDGDKAVADVVNKFIAFATPKLNEFSIGKQRLDLLQNPKLITPGGRQYDDFIGHSDEPLSLDDLPEDIFEEGDYDD